uniref:NOA1/YqeH-like C-terminal domain-containing protein n=1 Tax=Leersia perrieri TaxID=77586 RepID=A0A0D9VB46_9ORYZ
MAAPPLLRLLFPSSPAPPPLAPKLASSCSAVRAASNADGGGAGPAAPSRGDRFLGSQLAAEAAARVLAPEDAERRRRRREKRQALARKPSGASCYGCGAPLQTAEEAAPGYVDPATYELKKRHHQLRTVLCGRCKLLSHGHMVTAVGGHGGYPGGKQFVSAEELREKLSYLRHEKALIVKLVDIVDFNGSFLARVRDFAGANPIILVITKVDLLPRDTDFNCIGDWVVESVVKKKLNVLSVHLTSSKSLVGITGVISEIQQEKKKLYDTPGVHLHHRQGAVIHADDLPSLAPQSRLRARCFPANDTDVELSGNSLFWGGLVRIDVVKALPRTRLTFYGPKKLKINMVPTTEADEFYKKEVGVTLTPPAGKEKAEGWIGLQGVRELPIKYEEPDRPACDIAISGLGWIAVEPLGVPSSNPDESAEEEDSFRPIGSDPRKTTTMPDVPTSSGDSPPPPEGGSISSMVASSAASAAAAAADLTRRGEAFGADMAAAARAAIDTAIAHSQSTVAVAAEAASSAKADALAALPGLTLTAKEELEWIKNEYAVHEQMVFGKIKDIEFSLTMFAEGVIMAIENPGIAAGTTAVAGIVLFKRPRSYLIQRVRRMFVSKETLLSGIQAEVNHMRQTVNLVSNESQKLMGRRACHSKMEFASSRICHMMSCVLLGLKSILDQLPRAHASEFRSEISGLASQVKKEKRVLNNALSKIVNHGVPI